MQTIVERIAGLEKLLAERETALERKVRKTQVVYLVLAVVVVIYTTFVVSYLKEATSPKAIAEHLQAYLNSEVPQKREILVSRLRDSSPDLAKSAVASVRDLVPIAEEGIMFTLDSLTQELCDEVSNRIMPAFAEYLRAEAPRLKADFAELKDEEVGAGLVAVFMEVIDEELETYLNDKFVDEVSKLRARMVDLSRRTDSLTRKEDAERRALVYWSYLAQHGKVGSSVYFDALMRVKERFGIFFGPDAEDEEVDEDTGGDEPVNPDGEEPAKTTTYEEDEN